MAEPAYSTRSRSRRRCRSADDGENDVLGRDAARQLAFDGDAEGLGLGLRQRLRGQHVLHFAGADAKCQRAEGAVGRGVRVAADDGHARLGDAQLRADDVHDALIARVHVVELDAEVGAVLAQRGDLLGRNLIDDVERPSMVVGTLWSTVAMVRSGRRTLRPASRSPSKACGEVTSCSNCRSM
jgi:hypothetical protein